MRFTRTRLSDIVHPASSSQLAELPDRVRSFGGYNTTSLAQTAAPECRHRYEPKFESRAAAQ
jgi:hypothetical protein